MAGISSSSSGLKSSYKEGQDYSSSLYVLTSLFFIWALVTNLNDILIPHLKKACDLTDFESSLIQSAFFGAYFIMSSPAGWVIKKLGYKKGIIVGLLLMFIGAILFVPAALTRFYPIFLGALFILASGVTLLQVAANPYVSILGPPETSSSRLNLTQAFNSLGAAAGPWLGGMLILSGVEKTSAELMAMTETQKEAYHIAEASSVIMPYVGLSVVLLLIAALIHFSHLPEIDEELEKEEPEYAALPHSAKSSAWSYSHLTFGVIAIFFYVGAEVAIGSFIIRFAKLPEIAGLNELKAKDFVSYYMLFAMCGRFLGSWLLNKVSPSKTLGVNALMAILCLLFAVTGSGIGALWAIALVGLFNSIMFPTIFTLSIKDLGTHTKQGSSLLIMAIVGGAVIPPTMGLVSDQTNIQTAFLVPALCYISVLYFGFVGSKVKA